MEVYLQVRRAHFDEGRSKRSIARDFGLARGTVDKMCAFGPVRTKWVKTARFCYAGCDLPNGAGFGSNRSVT